MTTGRVTAAGNDWADELAKEGARDDSFLSILCDTYKAINYIGSFILQAIKRRAMARCRRTTSGMG